MANNKPLVRKKKHPTKDLYIHSYSKKAFFKKAWNEETINSRGHVYDANGKCLSSPFKKFFNIGENHLSEKSDVVSMIFHHWSEVNLAKKWNGHLCIVFHDGENWINTTSGSFEHDFIELDRLILEESGYTSDFFSYIPEDHTLMFEIIADYDPHVLTEKHKEEIGGEGAVIIGVNDRITGLEVDGWRESIKKVFAQMTSDGTIERIPLIPEVVPSSYFWDPVDEEDVEDFIEELRKNKNTEGVIISIPSIHYKVKLKTDWFIKERYKFQFNTDKTKKIFDDYEDSEEAFLKIPEEFHNEYQKIFDDYLAFTVEYKERLMEAAENIYKAYKTKDTVFGYIDKCNELGDLEKKAMKAFYTNIGLQPCIKDLFMLHYKKFSLVERLTNTKESLC